MNLNTKIEVVMRKEMTYGEYKNMMESAKKKGWSVQAYQIGVFSEGYIKKVK